MAETEVKFKRKSKLEIDSTPIEDGSILFSTDTPEIFMDNGEERQEYKIEPTEELDSKIKKAEEKADEIFASLPDDYLELSNKVEILNEGGLILKEDFISQQVNEWLDLHPESTTTVQDGSLDELKMTITSRRRIAREYRTFSDALKDNVWDVNTIVKTHGFYEFDDGGSGTYMISNYNPGDGNPLYFDYADGKYLVYIPENCKINICSLGAKRDGSMDCSDIMNNLFKTIRKVITKRYYTIFVPKGIYKFEKPLISNNIVDIEGVSSTIGTYIYEYNGEIYPKENCSIFYFPFLEEGDAFTIDIEINGSTNIKNIAFVSNSTEWKNDGFGTRPTIPYNPFSITKRVDRVNGLYIKSSHNSSIENCSFIGFSGYGLKTYSKNIHNCYFERCGDGIVNSKSDIMIQHCYITQCENGISAGADGVIFINNTFIDQCVEHGIKSDGVSQTTLVAKGCVIDHIGYSGIYINNALDCDIDARMGRCGMYYAGKTELADLSEEEIVKAVTIYYGNLHRGIIKLDVYKRSITDDSSYDEYKLPYVVFGGKYENISVFGLHKNDYEFFSNQENVKNSTVYSDGGVDTYS